MEDGGGGEIELREEMQGETARTEEHLRGDVDSFLLINFSAT